LKNILMVLAVLGGLCLTSTDALAGPLHWTVGGNDLNAALTGSFDYDADTNTFSNIDLLIYHIIPTDIFVSGSATHLTTSNGASDTTQTFGSALTNAGGTLSDSIDTPYPVTGTVSAMGATSGTPEPGSILLGGSGVLAFALLKLRRFRANQA
jgi:hypothetical protein